MAWKVLQGNVFDVLPTIPRGSVDCYVTSPPYWQLRSYLPKEHALKELELGSEPTIAQYIENQVRVFSLVRDCLADHGTCWVNIGDTYAGGGGGNGGEGTKQQTCEGSLLASEHRNMDEVANGNLCLIPQQLACALQDDGWIVRSIVIWHKPAPMPASVSGWAWRRCRVKTRSQENNNPAEMVGRYNIPGAHASKGTPKAAEWSDCPGCDKCRPNGGYVLRRRSWRPTGSYEPVLMLAKSANYFADGEPVKQPASAVTIERDKHSRILDDAEEQSVVKHDHETVCTGANLRDVWTIAAEALSEKHYAAYPTELVTRCLKSSVSEKGYCRTCGAPWARVIYYSASLARQGRGNTSECTFRKDGERPGSYTDGQTKTIGWRPTCSCADSSPRPGVVVDPFCGSGRTGIAARRLGLDFIGCELNPDYVEMAERRIEAALRDLKKLSGKSGPSLFGEAS